MSDEKDEGLGRRDLLKRGAVLGGAVLWTTPVVQSLSSPAFAAAGSPACSYRLTVPGLFCFTYSSSDPQKCSAFEEFYCLPYGASGPPPFPFTGAGQIAFVAYTFALFYDPLGISSVSLSCAGPDNAPVC